MEDMCELVGSQRKDLMKHVVMQNVSLNNKNQPDYLSNWNNLLGYDNTFSCRIFLLTFFLIQVSRVIFSHLSFRVVMLVCQK